MRLALAMNNSMGVAQWIPPLDVFKASLGVSAQEENIVEEVPERVRKAERDADRWGLELYP